MLPVIGGTLGVAAQPVTLEVYRGEVEYVRHEVRVILEDAHALPESGETALLREGMPATTEVVTENGTVTVSNEWFHAAMDAVDKETDPQGRRLILTDVDERLSAISWKAAQLQEAAESGRTKDEEKRKIAEILGREQFAKPSEPQQSAIEAWIISIIEWLMSFFPEPAPVEGSQANFAGVGRVVLVVIIGILVVLLGYGIYRMAPLLRSGRPAKRAPRGERVILGEKIEEEESPHDLFAKAEQLARSGDVRGAIRKGYIALLFELNERHVIGVARHKTNRDYLRDLRERKPLLAEMKGMTGMFERHWYGHGEPDNTTWESFRAAYQSALKEASAEAK